MCVCCGFLAKSPIGTTHFLCLQIPEHNPLFTLDVSLVPCPISHNPLPLFQETMFIYCPPHLFYIFTPPHQFSPFIFGQEFCIFSVHFFFLGVLHFHLFLFIDSHPFLLDPELPFPIITLPQCSLNPICLPFSVHLYNFSFLALMG